MRSERTNRRDVIRLLGSAGLVPLVPWKLPEVTTIPAVRPPGPPAGPECHDWLFSLQGSDRDPLSPTIDAEYSAIVDTQGCINSRPICGYAPGIVRFDGYGCQRYQWDLAPEFDEVSGQNWHRWECCGPFRFHYWFAVRRKGWTPEANHLLGPRRFDDFSALWLPGEGPFA